MDFLSIFFNSGSQFVHHPSQKRSVQLSNQISVFILVLSILLTCLYFLWYGWFLISKLLAIAGALSLVPVFLNRAGLTTASRIWLSLFLSVVATIISIWSKIRYYQEVAELDYFAFRFFLLAGCTLSPILFTFREKGALLFTSIVSFLFLLGYDPLHEAFGVPYPELLLLKHSYDFTNIIVLIAYCIIVGAIFFLKWISEKSEDNAANLIQALNQMNEALAEKNVEIKAQSAVLQVQSQSLKENQNNLENASKIIEEQKNNLFLQNKDLGIALLEKNKNLTDTNHELIKHNNELSQFSYTVSHNMRGPVASLLGLIQMLDNQDFKVQQDEIKRHLKSSVLKLDAIIRDLGKIIDIRHDIFRIRQKIHLSTELDSIRLMLKKDLDAVDTRFVVNFTAASEFYSVRPMVVSILYNLISNAIKYRSLERTPVIEVTSNQDDRYFILTVRDNGLGIDLKKYGDNLFKMYKRFHHHTEGKGLGLYLIKMQAEALNGRIEVQSQINSYSEFKVFIQIPENIEEQILMDESCSKIFYDATLNCTGVVWRGPVTSEQYRSTYLKGIEFLKAYNTPNWITDLSHQGPIDPVDQQWLFTEIIPQGIRNGLIRIAGVRTTELAPAVSNYISGIEKALNLPGITLKYFNSFEEARDWIGEENEKAASIPSPSHESIN